MACDSYIRTDYELAEAVGIITGEEFEFLYRSARHVRQFFSRSRIRLNIAAKSHEWNAESTSNFLISVGQNPYNRPYAFFITRSTSLRRRQLSAAPDARCANCNSHVIGLRCRAMAKQIQNLQFIGRSVADRRSRCGRACPSRIVRTIPALRLFGNRL